MALRCQVLLRGLAELREVILALGPPHRLADRVDRRQEQAHQDAENGDDDEQLHQRKGRIFLHEKPPWLGASTEKDQPPPGAAATIKTSVPLPEL